MPTLSETLADFLSVDRSPATNANYRYALTRLVDYLGEDRDIDLVTYRDLLRYADRLRPTVKASSFAQYVLTIKTFFNWCCKGKLIDHSPALNLKARQPPRDPEESRAMPVEVAQMIDRIAFAKPRDHALFLFLIDTGARIGGVASLRLSRLRLDEGSATLLEKGNKYVVVYFGEETVAALKRWLSVRPKVKHDYVFTSTRDDYVPLTADAMAYLIRSLSVRACGQAYGPHSIRHLVAQTWVDAGESPNTVQHKLGHSNVRITIERYYPQHNRDVKRVSRSRSLAALGNRPRLDANPKIIPLGDCG